jgi:hypothetical protein
MSFLTFASGGIFETGIAESIRTPQEPAPFAIRETDTSSVLREAGCRVLELSRYYQGMELDPR